MSDSHPRDREPVGREPILNLPTVIVWSIGVLVLIEAGRSLLSLEDDYQLIAWLSFVPARLTLWLSPDRLDELLNALGQSGTAVADRVQLARMFLADGGPRLWTLVSYGLLHGSWVHLISNLIWLTAFGSPVARRLGPGRFLNLMGLCTIAGALAHWWSRELDVLPMIDLWSFLEHPSRRGSSGTAPQDEG